MCDYVRHRNLYEKRLAFLRQSLEFVEQKQRLRKERIHPSGFGAFLLQLKQSQTETYMVKGVNSQLLHMVEDILCQKQEVISRISAQNPADLTASAKGRAPLSLHSKRIFVIPRTEAGQNVANQCSSDSIKDMPKSPEAYSKSFVKLQELDSSPRCLNKCRADALIVSSTCGKTTHADTNILEKVKTGQNGRLRLEHKCTPKEINGEVLQSFCRPDMFESKKDMCTDFSEGTIQRSYCSMEGNNKSTSLKSIESGWPDNMKQTPKAHEEKGDAAESTEQQQHLTNSHQAGLEAKERNAHNDSSFLERATESGTELFEDKKVASGCVVSDREDEPCTAQLHEQEKAINERERSALASLSAKEKLSILVNICKTMFNWENTSWTCRSQQWCNTRLVFSTIKAAKGGEEKIQEILDSKDSGSRLLICCEAICELMHAYPPENLLPGRFVKDCLSRSTFKTNVLKWAEHDPLLTYQDADSVQFWDVLTRHAVYLVVNDLATTKQIASIFTNILLPTSRMKDASKEETDNARLNLQKFINVQLGAKEPTRHGNTQSCINDEACQVQIALHEDNRLNMHEGASRIAMPMIRESKMETNQEVAETRSSSSNNNALSCMSCTMFSHFLPWKKIRLRKSSC